MIRLPILAAWKEFNDLMLALITGNRWKEAFNIFADMRSAWTPRLRSAQNRVPAELQKWENGWKMMEHGDLMGYHRDISMVISWIPSGKHHPHNLNIIPIVMGS